MLVVVLATALLAACGGLPSETAERTEPATEPELRFAVTAEHVDAVADLVWTLDNGRYEYFQVESPPNGAPQGSNEVPLVRGARSGGNDLLTVEFGVMFATEFGDDTRMNVVAADGRVCLNVPFYERRIAEAGPNASVAWMVPLVSGWGCLDADDVVDGAGMPSAALSLGDQNLYLRMPEMFRSARIVSRTPVTYRGRAVTEVEVELDPLAVARRIGANTAEAVRSSQATLRFDAGTGELVDLATTLDLSRPDTIVEERLEIYGRGTVESIGLPADATDITDEIRATLADE